MSDLCLDRNPANHGMTCGLPARHPGDHKFGNWPGAGTWANHASENDWTPENACGCDSRRSHWHIRSLRAYMAQAWAEGHEARTNHVGRSENPYGPDPLPNACRAVTSPDGAP